MTERRTPTGPTARRSCRTSPTCRTRTTGSPRDRASPVATCRPRRRRRAMSSAENPHAGQGMVVLDIGGDVGALVVSAPYLIGSEIEICPAGRRAGPPDDGAGWWVGDWHSHHAHAGGHSHGPAWPHVAVLERPQGDEWAPVAVFPGL